MPKQKKPAYDSLLHQVAREVVKTRGLSVRDLVQAHAGRSKNRLYEFLTGKADMKATGVADLFATLKLRIVDPASSMSWDFEPRKHQRAKRKKRKAKKAKAKRRRAPK